MLLEIREVLVVSIVYFGFGYLFQLNHLSIGYLIEGHHSLGNDIIGYIGVSHGLLGLLGSNSLIWDYESIV